METKIVEGLTEDSEQQIQTKYGQASPALTGNTALESGKQAKTMWIVAKVTAENTTTINYYVFKVNIEAADTDAKATAIRVNNVAVKETIQGTNKEAASPEELTVQIPYKAAYTGSTLEVTAPATAKVEH